MGCVEIVPKKTQPVKEFHLDNLRDCIEKGNIRNINKLKQLLQSINHSADVFEQNLIEVGSIKLSPLGYSLSKGKTETFKHLLDSGCSFKNMYDTFLSYKVKPLDLVLSKGDYKLFKAFFEEYEKIRISLISLDENLSSSAQIAARKGMHEILIHIYNQFYDSPYEEFNFSAPDENGENCGLIACREGNLPLIQFFHESCKVDLRTKNRFGDNAVMVCLFGYKKKRTYGYISCVKYLIETVQVDYSFGYVKMMSVADGEIFEYLSEKLKEIGIGVNKEELEEVEDSAQFIYFGKNFEVLCGNRPVSNDLGAQKYVKDLGSSY